MVKIEQPLVVENGRAIILSMKNQSSPWGVSLKYRAIVALVVVACFALFFQNCGMQVRFASTEGKLLAKNVGVESEELVEDGDGEVAVADNQVINNEVAATATPDELTNNAITNNEVTNQQTTNQEVSNSESEEDEGPLNFVCVLEGPGQSILLGYMDSTIAASKSTPDTVCTTQRGCMEIAKAKFPVRDAVEKAYCQKNKNVVRATEADLRQMIEGVQ